MPSADQHPNLYGYVKDSQLDERNDSRWQSGARPLARWPQSVAGRTNPRQRSEAPGPPAAWTMAAASQLLAATACGQRPPSRPREPAVNPTALQTDTSHYIRPNAIAQAAQVVGKLARPACS